MVYEYDYGRISRYTCFEMKSIMYIYVKKNVIFSVGKLSTNNITIFTKAKRKFVLSVTSKMSDFRSIIYLLKICTNLH